MEILSEALEDGQVFTSDVTLWNCEDEEKQRAAVGVSMRSERNCDRISDLDLDGIRVRIRCQKRLICTSVEAAHYFAPCSTSVRKNSVD